MYSSECADTDADFCPLEWWRRSSADKPTWSACARKVLLVQPSSAASERAFSMLKASFHEQQDIESSSLIFMAMLIVNS